MCLPMSLTPRQCVVNKRKRKRSHVIRNFVCGTAALPVSYCRVVCAGAEGMLGSKLVVQA